jgi:membrane protease YdiL (CAAX protease family)
MRRLKAIFWNGQEHRLRAGWRLVVQLLLFILVQIALGVVSTVLGKRPVSVVAVIALYPMLGAALIWFVGRFVDHRRAANYGFHLNSGWWASFAFGALLGAGLMTGIFITERLAGWIVASAAVPTDTGFAPLTGALLSLVFYLTVAWMEEFTFRGYELRNLSEGFVGAWVGPRAAIVGALLISSGLFGLLHATNHNATLVSTLNIMLAGVLLALPYVLTGELAVSIGLHLSWNFFQGTVFGFPVSGSAPTRRLMTIEQSGPEAWTGGAFGPEGGLIGIVAVLIGCGLIPLWVNSRKRNVSIDVDLARYEPRAAPAMPHGQLAEAPLVDSETA